MNLESCRDCGEPMAAGARGCRRCARNAEAERMVAKYLLLGGALVVLLLLCLAALLLARRDG